MNLLISVIVPVYNVEEYLPACIDSIINQTYNKLEIILINDGSTDKSGQICESYALKDSRIKVYNKKNGGLSDSRNKGLDNSTGNYIAFIDSDDYIHPQYFEILLNNLIDQNKDISFCFITSVDFVIDKEVYFLNFDSFFFFEFNVQSVVMCNKLFKAEIWKELRFEVGKFHEDEFIYHKLFYNKSFCYTTSALYHYRKREGSIMSTSNEKRRSDAREAFDTRYQFFKDEDGRYTKKVIHDILQLNLRYYNAYRDKESILFLRRNTFNILALKTHNWKEKLFLLKSIWIFYLK